jgi:hypothetical protein
MSDDDATAGYPTTFGAAKESGAEFYYTGTPCKYGHVARRRTSNRRCRICEAEASKRAWRENPETGRERARKSYHKNAEKISVRRKAKYADDPEYREKNKEAAARWDSENPERKKETRRKWLANNRDRFNAASRVRNARYRETHRGRIRVEKRATAKKLYEKDRSKYTLKGRLWKKANPEICRAIEANRRAAKESATPPWFTKVHQKEIRALYQEARRRKAETGVEYEIDHIIPLVHARVCGLHVPWNLQILTSTENKRKNNYVEGLPDEPFSD